jgi:type I restriction enzyme S subunit
MPTSIPLSKAAKVIMGQSPPGDTYNEDGVGLPLLNGPTEFGPTHPECSLFTTDTRRECEPGDLIFCVRGSTTGRMNWADRKYSLGRGVCAFRATSQAETRFVRYCIQDRLHALLQLAGGGTFPNLTKDTIESFEIPWPDDRVRIACILSAYDELIENSQRRIKILESMVRALYREWFVHFRFPGHDSVSLDTSPIGTIPQGWETKTLGSLTKLITKGTTPTTLGRQFQEDGINFVKAESIEPAGILIESRFAKIDASTHELLQRSQLCSGDILYSIAGVIGRVCSVPTRILPANTNQALAIIRSASSIHVPFLYMTLRDDSFKNYCLGHVVQTAQANVSLSVLKAVPIICPSTAVLTKFNAHAEPLLQQIQLLSERIQNLRRTGDLLLPRLVSGQIDLQATAA